MKEAVYLVSQEETTITTYRLEFWADEWMTFNGWECSTPEIAKEMAAEYLKQIAPSEQPLRIMEVKKTERLFENLK